MILLTHGYFINEDEKERSIMKPYVPLGILYLSAYLEQKKIPHNVFDTTFSSFNLLCEYLLCEQPKLIGMYTNLMTKVNVIRIIQFIRENKDLSDTKVILGGPEIRHNAKRYLQSGADLVVIGEGEQTFAELCENYIHTNQLAADTEGTALLENGELKVNAERPLIKDINTLPQPARHNVDLHPYLNAWKKYHGYSMLSVSTMRGCPYTCKWCSRAVYGGSYRRRGAGLVADELQRLVNDYKPDRFWFVDDVFTINHKWLREFCAELAARDLQISYEIITRADRMNDEVIALLKKSGCFRIWIGAESGSQKIIDAMDRRVDVAQVREMIIKTKAAGMEAGTFIMLGYPGESRSDIRQTIRHLNVSSPSSFTVTLAYPITGTPLYDEVRGTLNTSNDWSLVTDRDSDFKRTHSKRYYEQALRWVHSEVALHKTKNPAKKLKLKARSLIAQAAMLLHSGH